MTEHSDDQPVTCYHVAARCARASIRRHGIDPRRFHEVADPVRYGNYQPFRPTGFFLFDNLASARWYAERFANEEPVEVMDIWEVRPRVTLEADWDLVPGGDAAMNQGSWFHRGFVRPVRLVETIHPWQARSLD